MITRRRFLKTGVATAAVAAAPFTRAATDPIAPYRTTYKFPELILKATSNKQDFDGLSVDDPIVFRAEGQFHMLYIGYDGTGYQTLAISSILRDKNLHGRGEALKVNGQYLAAWNAYPSAGYEEGAAVIGLATSRDLLHWTLTEPILYPADGEPWEHGGLYRADLFLDKRTYYLYYNAKTDTLPKSEGGGWHEQTGVATSTDLKRWTRYAGNPILRNGPRGSSTLPASNPLYDQVPPTADARDSRFASNPFVVKNGSEYAMFYFGFGYQRPGRACEMLALGQDPLHFKKVSEILIDTGAPGSIDETFAHKPSIIYNEGSLYHFYCAVSGKYPNEVRGIGVARSRPW